jgi:hypothetical protein
MICSSIRLTYTHQNNKTMRLKVKVPRRHVHVLSIQVVLAITMILILILIQSHHVEAFGSSLYLRSISSPLSLTFPRSHSHSHSSRHTTSTHRHNANARPNRNRNRLVSKVQQRRQIYKTQAQIVSERERESQEWKDDIILKNKFLSDVFDFQAITEHGEIIQDITYKANLQIKELVDETFKSSHHAYNALQAERILNCLEQLNRADTITYNLVINAFAKSSLQDSAHRAAQLLNRMEIFYERQMERMNEWSQCDGNAEERRLLHKELLEECGIFDVEQGAKIFPSITVKPNVRTYSSVIDAYSRTSNSNLEGADSAQALLERLRTLYESTGDEELKPNVISYNSVINAWAKTGTVHGAETALKLLDTMEREGIADAISYNACIHAWARCGSKESGRKAEAILRRMKEQAARAKSSDVDYININQSYAEPNIRTYSSVIDAWSRSKNPTAPRRAQAILDEMEKIYEETGDRTIQPNTVTYSTVINAHAKSKDMDTKAAAALKVLKRMQHVYSSGENDLAKPTIVTYNSVLNACATTYGVISSERNHHESVSEIEESDKSESQSLALNIVKDLYKDLTCPESYIKPDHFTYGTVLKACANLMSPGDDDAIRFIREVFDQCCKGGQVSFGVCFQLRQAAPLDLYRELIPTDAIDESNGHFIIDSMPYRWRKNVKEKRPYTKLR